MARITIYRICTQYWKFKINNSKALSQRCRRYLGSLGLSKETNQKWKSKANSGAVCRGGSSAKIANFGWLILQRDKEQRQNGTAQLTSDGRADRFFRTVKPNLKKIILDENVNFLVPKSNFRRNLGVKTVVILIWRLCFFRLKSRLLSIYLYVIIW